MSLQLRARKTNIRICIPETLNNVYVEFISTKLTEIIKVSSKIVSFFEISNGVGIIKKRIFFFFRKYHHCKEKF